jgi:hypothetical protein
METSLRNLLGIEQMLESSFQAFTDLIIVLNYDGLIVDSRWGSHLPPIFTGEIVRRELRDVFPSRVVEKIDSALKTV